jgi:hypothetical protein
MLHQRTANPAPRILKFQRQAMHQGLMPLIPDTWEAEIGRTIVQDDPCAIISKITSE